MKKNYTLVVYVTLMSSVFLNKLFSQTYQDFKNSYGILSTIAGTGNIDDKGINGWQAGFEGGSAIGAELSRPHMAMADTAGNIYIADKDAHAIRKVDKDGIITTVAGTSTAGDNGDGPGTEHLLNAPNGLWVTENGTLYILDLNNSKIRKLEPAGNMTTVVNDTNGIPIGRGLYVTKNEDSIFYACGTLVKRWTATSGIDTFSTGYIQLGNIVQDPSGNLVITDRGANLVYRVSKEGNAKEIIAGNGKSVGGGDGFNATESALYGVRGIWFLNDGSYFLATHEGSKIWHVDTDGILHLFLNGIEDDDAHFGDGEDYQTPGFKISEARAVTVDNKGNVLITENDRGFIRKVARKDGSIGISGNEALYSKIKVYPNPANSHIKIEMHQNGSSSILIRAINTLGKSVDYQKWNNVSFGKQIFTFDTQKLSPGIYMIQIELERRTFYKRILVEK